MVVEASGSVTCFAKAVKLVEPCGIVIMKSTVAEKHELNLAPLVVNEVSLVGSRCGPFKPARHALSKILLRSPILWMLSIS